MTSQHWSLFNLYLCNDLSPIFDEPSNRHSVNSGLRSNRTTPALTFIGCSRACKLLQTTKGSTAESCPVTRAYQTSQITSMLAIEASNTETCMRASTVPDDCVITLSAVDVSKTFKQVNIHKAAGPDGLPGCVLRACADNWQVSSLTFSTSPCL